MKKAATCVMQIAANCFMIIYYPLSESIVDEQEDAQIGNGGELFWWQLYIKLQPLLAPLQRNDAGKSRELWNVSPKHICHWATPTNGAD